MTDSSTATAPKKKAKTFAEGDPATIAYVNVKTGAVRRFSPRMATSLGRDWKPAEEAEVEKIRKGLAAQK